MSGTKFPLRDLTFAAILAAVYAVLTVTLPIPQYAGIQCRLSEAFTVLPFLFPAAAPGLVVGCFIANLFSPYPLDLIFGTAATLLACWLTRRMPNRWLASLPPVVCNTVIVGGGVRLVPDRLRPGLRRGLRLQRLHRGGGGADRLRGAGTAAAVRPAPGVRPAGLYPRRPPARRRPGLKTR